MSVALHIKNMVCSRCKAVVKDLLETLELHPVSVELGEVMLAETSLNAAQKQSLQYTLQAAGFELIDDKTSRAVEAIKNLIVRLVHHTEEPPKQKYSELISAALHQDYSALSRLFSEHEGITIEQYIILQKIEKAKELLVYDELSLAQIAWQMGYSSTAHLSAQFKKTTGMTPSYFKSLRDKDRKPLDEVGKD